jgi:predicted GNAT superfamily acetyltransferase
VNADPPNPASDSFHAAFGFVVVGSATLSGGNAVRHYAHTLG